jgi:cytochrome P450
MTFFLPDWVRLPGQRRAEKAIGRIEDYLWSMVSERRGAATGCPHDLLSVFIDSTDKGNGSSPAKARKLLRDHIMTSLFGGYESTASSLIWMWCLLSRHPEVAERVRAEIDQVIGERSPAYEDLGRLTYTEMVIDEVLRLYPPFWGSFRSSYKDDVIDGIRIPGGSSLILCPYATQRDPRIWEDPEIFNPERFRPDAQPRHRCAYYPFLEGPRSCIGRFFAIAEMKVVVAQGLRSYRLDLPPGFRLDSIAEGTLRIRHVPWVRVTKR